MKKYLMFILILISLLSCSDILNINNTSITTTTTINYYEALDNQYVDEGKEIYESKIEYIQQEIIENKTFIYATEYTEYDTGEIELTSDSKQIISLIMQNTEYARMILDSSIDKYQSIQTDIKAQDLLTNKNICNQYQSAYIQVTNLNRGVMEDYVAGILDQYDLKSLNLVLPNNISAVAILPPLPYVNLNGSIISGSFPFQLGSDNNGTPVWCKIVINNVDLDNLSNFNSTQITFELITPLIIENLFILTDSKISITQDMKIIITGNAASVVDRIDFDDGNYWLEGLSNINVYIKVDISIIEAKVTYYEVFASGKFSFKSEDYLWHIPFNPGVNTIRFSLYELSFINGNLNFRVRMRDPSSGRSSEVDIQKLNQNSIINPLLSVLELTKVLKELSGTEVDNVNFILSSFGLWWVVPAALTLQAVYDHNIDPTQNMNQILIGNFITVYGQSLISTILELHYNFKIPISQYEIEIQKLMEPK